MDDATQSLCRKYRGKVAEYLVAMQDKEDDAVDTKEHPSSSESTLFTAFFTAIYLLFKPSFDFTNTGKRKGFPVQKDQHDDTASFLIY